MNSQLQSQLAVVGQRLNHWQAALRAAIWGSAWLAALIVVGFADVFLQFTRTGRLLAWGIALAVFAMGLWRVLAALNVRRTAMGIAARIERAFPQLDNHLINYVQFAGGGAREPLAAAYLDREQPAWEGLDLDQLKDQRRHRRAYAVLGALVIAALLPFALIGPGWANALARVLNPFSARPAATIAQLLDIQPGNTTVTRGAPLTFTVNAAGQGGQAVWLELWPSDDQPTRRALGTLADGREPTTLTHTLPRTLAPLEYRVRAGDARSARFTVDVRPPLALTALQVEVEPPAHTGLARQTVDALAEPVRAPQGSRLAVMPTFNRPLAADAVRVAGAPALLTDAGWIATVRDTGRRDIPLVARADGGETFESALAVEWIADRAPVIQVIAPTQRVALAPGALARIQFQATDDHGLRGVWLEADDGERAGEWPVDGAREFAALWSGAPGRYRLVARDDTQETRSALLVFDVATPQDMLAAQERATQLTAATLARLVAWQRENLERTGRLVGAVTAPAAAAAADVQRQIRAGAGQLLADPRRPLGALATVMTALHQHPMAEAIDVLDRLPTTTADQQPAFLARALALETAILRGLLSAQANYERIEQQRKTSDLLALLDALVSGETAVVRAVAELSEATAVPSALVARQDRLAGDVTDFVRAARAEAARSETNDPEFAALVRRVADECERRGVAANMLRAAERLEVARPAEALPLAEQALAALREFQAWLNAWRVVEARTTLAEIQRVVAEAKDKFEKLVQLQAKVVESMRAVEAQEDLTAADHEQFAEELKAMQQNIRAAGLKIADDLHIFPQLPVGNELVRDIYQVFEEVQQVPGSERAPADELGLQKEDFMLEAMESIKERFDDMEMWLVAEPDKMKRLTENFDQAEMPEMAVLALPEEIEDIIGELLEQQDEIREAADDSATNQATPDMPMGWDIAEGEWSTFSAKGKTGNERPEHKDQDGRAIVGREGMADGETGAGDGKIHAGDEKIEERRTRDSAQAGQVAEEDHTDAKATGGGKLSGFDDETGMAGEGPRRDANLPPSLLGLQALLRRDAEAVYARATLLHIRTGGLDEAVQAMRDAEDAINQGLPIQRVREFQRRASAALQRAQMDLAGGVYTEAGPGAVAAAALIDQTAGVPEEAPANYRDLVADYYKSLSVAP